MEELKSCHLLQPAAQASSKGHLTQKCWHARAAAAKQSPGLPVQASVVPVTGTCHQMRHIKSKGCYPSFQQSNSPLTCFQQSTDWEPPVLGTPNASENINALKLLH